MRRSGFDGSGLRSWASYTFLRVLVRASVYAEFNTAYRVMRRRGHRVRGHRRRWRAVGAGGRAMRVGGLVTAAATTRAQLLYPRTAAVAQPWLRQQTSGSRNSVRDARPPTHTPSVMCCLCDITIL
ncbi:hypothetical protein QTP88_022161 [Uroleucon formosanum]